MCRKQHWYKKTRRERRVSDTSNVLELLDDLHDAVRVWIDQHGPVVDDRISIVLYAVFCGNLVVGNAGRRQLGADHDIAVVPIRGPFFLHNVGAELRTPIVGNAADNRAAYAANNRTNRAADDRATDRTAYGTGRCIVLSICRERNRQRRDDGTCHD